MSTRVIKLKGNEKFDVFIGRPSKYGNKYSHLAYANAIQVSSRDEAISKFEIDLRAMPQEELIEFLKPLVGKILACYCINSGSCDGKLWCHGQVYMKLIKELCLEDNVGNA